MANFRERAAIDLANDAVRGDFFDITKLRSSLKLAGNYEEAIKLPAYKELELIHCLDYRRMAEISKEEIKSKVEDLLLYKEPKKRKSLLARIFGSDND